MAHEKQCGSCVLEILGSDFLQFHISSPKLCGALVAAVSSSVLLLQRQ